MTVKICYSCDHDIYPRGKPLFDLEADNAIVDKNGNVKCRECVKEEFNKDLIRYAPNSPAAKQVIAEHKRKEEYKARFERLRKQPGKRLSYYEHTGLKRYDHD